MTTMIPVGAVGNALGRVSQALKAAEMGQITTKVGSVIETKIAGRIWTAGRGARPIRAGRGTGAAKGRINGDRVYRQAQVKNTGPRAGKKAANLEDKAADTNTHVVVESFIWW